MKKVIVRIQFGSRSCIEDGGGMVCDYVCSTQTDADNLLKAVDDAMGFEGYEVVETDDDDEVSV